MGMIRRREELKAFLQAGGWFSTTYLARRFEVSCNTVEEPLREWFADGLVERRHGDGLLTWDEPVRVDRAWTSEWRWNT